MSNTTTLVLQNYPATKTVSIAEGFFFFPSFPSQQGVLDPAHDSATSVGCVCRPHPNVLNYY